MRIGAMRRADLWIGEPLCRAAGIVRPGRPRPVPDRPARLLVMKCMGMGSLLLLAPTVSALRRRFPSARLDLLTFKANEPLARRLGLFDAVLAVRTSSARAFAADVGRHLAALRVAPPDLSFDLEFFSRFTALFATLAGARLRVGFRSEVIRRGDLCDLPVAYTEDAHVSDVFFRQAAAVGADRPGPYPRLVPTPEGAREARAAMPEAAFVAANPNASPLALERRWMPERYAEVVRRLRRAGLGVALVGDASERAYTEAVRRAAGDGDAGVRNLAGLLSLEGLLALLARARLLVSNDSGPPHLAAAVGTPALVLFGPETPALYGPVAAGGVAHRTIYRPVHCSPCMSVFNAKRPTCGGKNVCMEGIEVEEVWRAAREMLGLPAAAAVG